jgi:hypothetical protein
LSFGPLHPSGRHPDRSRSSGGGKDLARRERTVSVPRALFFPCIFFLTFLAPALAALPGTVQAAHDGDSITLSNDAIAATWSVRDGSLNSQSLTNHFTGITLPLAGSVFELVPREGPVLQSSDFKMISAPIIEEAPVSHDSSKAADRLPGRQVRIELEDPCAKVHVTWRAILREDANYIRQEVTIRTPNHRSHSPSWFSSMHSFPGRSSRET